MLDVQLKRYLVKRVDRAPNLLPATCEGPHYPTSNPDCLVGIEITDLMDPSKSTLFNVYRGDRLSWAAVETVLGVVYVIAGGKVWRLDLKSARSEYCNIDDAIELVAINDGSVIVACDVDCTCLDGLKVRWVTRRLSWDGLEDMVNDESSIRMQGWHAPSQSWKPVVINVRGDVLESAYF